jgi:predicted kinase
MYTTIILSLSKDEVRMSRNPQAGKAHMSKALLVLINGHPGTGKTTLGKRLAKDLALPFLSKDDLKERLFDTLGVGDQAWSRKLGHASVELLFLVVERQLEAGASLVMEMPFIPEFHTSRFLDLAERCDFEPLQICCTCDEQVLYERFRRRAETGERHPGHVDQPTTFADFKSQMQRERHLDIGGLLIHVDTTDFEKVDYPDLLATVARQYNALQSS